MAAIKQRLLKKYVLEAVMSYLKLGEKGTERRKTRWYFHPLNKTRRQDGEFSVACMHTNVKKGN